VPIERGRELAGAIPGAHFVAVENAGHILVTDAEEQVLAAILDHLESSAGDPARRDAA